MRFSGGFNGGFYGGFSSGLVVVTPPPVNIYVNPEYIGASDNAIGGMIAPDFHGFSFASCDTVANDLGDGTFSITINDAFLPNVRRSLTYDVGANNPTLEVGATYALRVWVDNSAGGSSNKVSSIENASGIVILRNEDRVTVGTAAYVHIEFVITDQVFGLDIRIGCGPTTDATVRVTLSKPELFLVAPAVVDGVTHNWIQVTHNGDDVTHTI